MATVRCERHKPRSLTRPYAGSVRPVGHPGSIDCQAGACPNPGLVWLTRDEKDAYDAGERVFSAKSPSMRVRVE